MKYPMMTKAVLAALTLLWCGLGITKEMPLKPVKINAASKEELMQLPGVGEKKAEVILSSRSSKAILNEEDLKAVKGIGESMVFQWKGLIDYSTDASASAPAPAPASPSKPAK